MKAVFDQNYVKAIEAVLTSRPAQTSSSSRSNSSKKSPSGNEEPLFTVVMIWAASTEIFLKQHPVHKTLESFEKAMRENHKSIAPSMIYAYAALKSGIPFANGAPNLTVDIPGVERWLKKTIWRSVARTSRPGRR
jgi:myo-inositol-1-phosphate synthase